MKSLTLANQTSAPWSFSDYYKEMSFDSLKIYGKGYFIITEHTESYYRDSIGLPPNNKNDAFWYSTKEVLQTLNSQINNANYDIWKDTTNLYTPDSPDGIVDLIIVVYRQSIYPPGVPAQGIAVLGY